MTPFFSIIIPLYNKQKHILDTLNSVLGQTFKDYEVIVVNDGSTDNSEAEVQKVDDARIKLYRIPNKGVSNARNFGVSKAGSNSLVLLDADDYWKPNHLQNLYNLMRLFPNCGLYATAYESKFDQKTIPSAYFKIPNKKEWSGIIDDFFVSSRINCIASASSVMISKKVYNALGGFNTTYDSGEDVDFWIRLALKYPIAFTNQSSVIININAENQASKRSIKSRNHLDFDTFEEEKYNDSLKQYLDLNRFSLAIQHRIAGNITEAKKLILKIDTKNLNTKQKTLLKMNSQVLERMLKIKNLLRKKGIGLSAFR